MDKLTINRNIILNIFMFLIGFNFMGNAIPLIYCLFLYCIYTYRTSKFVPKFFLIIILLFLSMLVSSFLYDDLSINSFLKIGAYPSIFLSFYLIANSFMLNGSDSHVAINVFFQIILFFFLGNMIHLIADVLISDIDSINMGNRVLNDIWSGGTAPSTIIVGWGIMALPVLIMATFSRKNNYSMFVITVVITIIYVVSSFVVATRLGIVNLILLFGVYILLSLLESDYNINKNTLIKGITATIILIFIGYHLFPLFLNSNLFLRLNSNSLSLFDSNGRFEASRYLLQHFFDHIWGGGLFEAEYGIPQHNIVFQMYDLYGLVPFSILVYILLFSSLITYRIFNSKSWLKSDRLFMVTFFTSLLLYFFEEPVITSNFIITSLLFAYIGYSIPLVKQLKGQNYG